MPKGFYVRGLSLRERFEQYLEPIPECGCIIWTGYSERGYGVIKVNGKLVLAHRLAWELKNGPIPEGKHILHSCDTPPCCNPNHLRPGTDADNARDCKERKRNKKGRPGFKGEDHSMAKLTEQQVLEIRADKRTYNEIAKSHGISKSNVKMIRCRKTWTHI